MSGNKYNILNTGTGSIFNNNESHNSGVQNNYGARSVPESSSSSSSAPFSLLADGPCVSLPKAHQTIPLKLVEDTNPNSHALALIINIYKYENQVRTGSDVDCTRLEKILRAFNVGIYTPNTDVTKEMFTHRHIDDWITEFKGKFQGGSSAKVSLVFVMGHGEEPNHLLDSHNQPECLERSVFTRFNNARFPAMIDKPKLFFMNCCRGDILTPPVLLPDSMEFDKPPPTSTVPTISDILISWSTTPGNYSTRGSREGSLFIRLFCDQMEKYYKYLKKNASSTEANYEFSKAILDPVAKEMKKEVAECGHLGRVTQTPNIDIRTFGHFTWLIDNCIYIQDGKPLPF